MKRSIVTASAEALLSLVRWPNALLAALGVIAGAWWVAPGSIAAPTWFAAAAAICLAALSYAANDLFDREIDRVAHPQRPLPSGRLSTREATVTAFTAGVLGIALAFGASVALGLLSVAVAALMVAYSRWFKTRGLLGNALVAVLASLPFVYGAWTAGDARSGLALLLVAVPLHAAREIAKDVADVRADEGHRRTLPIALGVPRARGIAILLIACWWIALLPLVRGARISPRHLPLAIGVIVSVIAALRLRNGRDDAPSLLRISMGAATAWLVAAPQS